MNPILDRINASRLFDLPVDWAHEIIFPHYNGLSLRNITHSVAAALGAPLPDHAPLDPAVWGEVPPPDVQRVVLFLMDGTGYLYLQQLRESDTEIAELLDELGGGRAIVPLTSVAPSTTCVALTTLWTGATPNQHGVFGTLQVLRQFSTIADMLHFRSPTQKNSDFDAWGLKAETFVPVRGFAEHLEACGVEAFLLLRYNLVYTGLSRFLHRGIAKERILRHAGFHDFPLRLRDALRATRGKRAYLNIYWDGVDTTSHAYHALSEYARNEILQNLRLMRDALRDPAAQDVQTLFILTADHGHHDAPNKLNMLEDARLQPVRDALRLGTGGDNRLPQLYLREGTRQTVLDTLAAYFADTLAVVDAQTAVEAGFFGAPPHHWETFMRLGDLMLIPRLGTMLYDPSVAEYDIVSYHGGLSAWEMLTPFLWRVL